MGQLTVRRGTAADLAEAQAVNLAAFRPIDQSFAQILGPEIYSRMYPNWEDSQQRELADLVDKPNVTLFIAESNGRVVGFMVIELDDERKSGELCMLAVHPDAHRQGIGAIMNDHALQFMRESGMSYAEVETGGDHSHAAARRSYEKAGYIALPVVRYYKAL